MSSEPRSEKFHDVAPLAAVPPGQLRGFTIGSRKIVVAHTAAGIYAADDACPHRGGPLSEGDLVGGEILCPWHFWAFDPKTGCHTGGSKFALVTHEVRVENERVLVRLADPPLPTG